MRQYSLSAVLLASMWLVLVVGALAAPVRRTPGLEARRRSAIDRSLVRFGRSYPPEPSAADIRESFQRPTRRGNSFLRLGRSQPLAISAEDLISLLRSYDNEYEDLSKRASNFVRFGRDPKFIRLGRSVDEDKALGIEQSSDLVVNGYPQRKNRARDHFVRFGRDSEELGEDVVEEESERRKRSVGSQECPDCR